MERAFRLFADEQLASKRPRDPVAPAKRSDHAEKKARRKKLADGLPVHSFQSLLANLKSIFRNTCKCRDVNTAEPYFVIRYPVHRWPTKRLPMTQDYKSVDKTLHTHLI